MEVLNEWGMSPRNLRVVFHGRTPVQTRPAMKYHGARTPSPCRTHSRKA